MINPPEQVSKKQNTTDSNLKQSVPTISINNVSSYAISCAINGTPASFLIDTKAGVCLVKSEVWERVKSNPNTLKPITAH